jgi:hypothetical protein
LLLRLVFWLCVHCVRWGPCCSSRYAISYYFLRKRCNRQPYPRNLV